MALPLEFYENFESGSKGTFDLHQDDGDRLDFPYARDLAPITPYRGAYCCRVNLGKNSTDAYLDKAVNWAIGQTRWGRFRLFIGNDVQIGNNRENVRILQWYSATATKECFICLGRSDPDGLVLGCAEEDGGTTWYENSYITVPRGEWLSVEWFRFVHGTTAVVGVLRAGVAFAKCDQGPEAANTRFRLGAMDQLGSDIQGTLLFDDFAVDDSRLYEDLSAMNGALSGGSLFYLQSGFVFLGPGIVEHISLIDGGSGNCKVVVYDTDDRIALPLGGVRETLVTQTVGAVSQSRHRGFRCNLGCYLELTGTNAQALVRLGQIDSDGQ